MKDQCRQVLSYIRQFGSITHLQAFKDLGIANLAARIFDLKKAGYPITKIMVTSVNRYGKKVSFAKYSLNENKDN